MMTPTKSMKRKASDVEDTTAASGNESSSPCKMPRNMEMSEEPWTADECRELVAQLQEKKTLLPKDFRSALKKVDWDTMKIGEHEAESVHHMAEKLTHCVRKYRTLSEVLDDCITEIDGKRIGRLLIQYPKRPKTIFLDYLARHIDELKAECPGSSVTDLAKVAGEKFKHMPEKKKQKYVQRYSSRKEDFEARMVQLKEDHPEIFPSKPEKVTKPKTPKKSKTANKLSDVVTKPKFAKQHYLDVQVDGKMKKHPERSRDELIKKFTKKWSKFSDDEKEPWLLLAADDKLRYQADIEECRGDPRFTDEELTRELGRAPSQLSKNEVNLKLTELGKPKTPPKNGYQHFMSEYWADTGDSGRKMHEVVTASSRAWKALSEAQKEQYKLLVKQQQTTYKKDLEEWRRGLSPEDESLVAKLENMIRPKRKETTVATKKKAVPAGQGKTGQVKVKMPAFAKKLQEKEERQTTIIEHFSPSITVNSRRTASDSSECESSSKSDDKDQVEDSDEYHSPGSGSEGDFRSLDDFKLAKPIKPRPTLASLGSPKKSNGTDRLTPQIISPMVCDSPSKKLKKKK